MSEERNSKWEPVDFIICMLVVVICFTVIGSIALPLFRGTELPETKAKMVAGIVVSVVSIVSMYVGAKIQQKKRDN